jgi:hypothetical protein
MTTNNMVNASGPLNDGQIWIGATGAQPIAENLTAGTGINIVNAAHSITISSTGDGLQLQLQH